MKLKCVYLGKCKKKKIQCLRVVKLVNENNNYRFIFILELSSCSVRHDALLMPKTEITLHYKLQLQLQRHAGAFRQRHYIGILISLYSSGEAHGPHQNKYMAIQAILAMIATQCQLHP